MEIEVLWENSFNTRPLADSDSRIYDDNRDLRNIGPVRVKYVTM